MSDTKMVDEMHVGDDVKILLSDIKMVSPALDCNPDETLLLTVPLPGIRTVQDRKGVLSERGEMVLCTITSKREIFETSQKEFMRKKWLAQIPNPIIDQRWSAACIKSFLEGTAPEVSPWDVFVAIRDRFEHYIDFGGIDSHVDALALYTFASYYFFLFEYFPYLKLGGEKNSAKTKTGSIVAALAFNGMISASWTKAVIYRFAQDTRGSMVIDEAEGLQYKNEEKSAFIEVLNSGWQRNGFAILVDKDTMRPTKYSTYCPKVICSIGGLEEVLGDRAFEIILLRTFDRTLADRAVEANSKEWLPIRDAEYLCLMQHWKEVQELIPTVGNVFSSFSGRVWNLAKPLLTIARFVNSKRPADVTLDIEASIKSFIEEQARDKVVKAREGFANSVVTVLHQMMENESRNASLLDKSEDLYVRIDLMDLTARVKEAEGNPKLEAKEVARTLLNLEIYKDVRRDGHNGARRFGIRPSELTMAEARVLGRKRSANTTDATDATDGTDGEMQAASASVAVTDALAVPAAPSISPSVPSVASVSSVVSKSVQSSSLDGSKLSPADDNHETSPVVPERVQLPTSKQVDPNKCSQLGCERHLGKGSGNGQFWFKGKVYCAEHYPGPGRKASSEENSSP